MTLQTLTLGLALPYGTQPGPQLGLGQSLGERFYLQEQLAVTMRPANHVAGLAELELGLNGPSFGRWNSQLGVGLGYELRAQVIGQSVHLGTGASTREFELRHAVIPAVNGRLSWMPSDTLGGYGALGVGRRMPIGREGELYALAELGLVVRLGGAK